MRDIARTQTFQEQLSQIDMMTSYLTQLNERQRLGMFVAIVLVLLVLVIHNPTQGYVTEYWSSCENIPDILCDPQLIQLGFFMWKSTGAMFDSLSTLGAAAVSIFAIVGALFSWLFLFSIPKNDSATQSN
jgi:hypothetical protein